MAVLVEAISVIVRRDAIEDKFPGGWRGFAVAFESPTLCTDGQVARVGFMTPDDVGRFINRLEHHGFVFLEDDRAIDLAVADQTAGPTTACDWLEFAKLPWDDTGTVSACWLFEGPRRGAGIHLAGETLDLCAPPGWAYEGSLSQLCTVVEVGRESERLRFLRHESGVDVFLDLETGKTLYQGRRG